MTFSHLTDVKHPQVAQPAAAHSSVDDKSVEAAAARHHGCVTLSGGRGLTRRGWDLPADHAGTRTQLQAVQVVQVPEGESWLQILCSHNISVHSLHCGNQIQPVYNSFQTAEVSRVPGDVVLWVFTVIGQSSKQVTGTAN